jgi:hypothetical protein
LISEVLDIIAVFLGFMAKIIICQCTKGWKSVFLSY